MNELEKRYDIKTIIPLVERMGYKPDYVNELVGDRYKGLPIDEASAKWWFLVARKGFFTLTVHNDGRSYMALDIPLQKYFDMLPGRLCDEYSIDFNAFDDDVGLTDFNIFEDTSMVRKFEDAYLSKIKQMVGLLTTDYAKALKEMEE